MCRALTKNAMIASERREAPDVIIGTMTSCIDPAKMKKLEAVVSSTLYPASLIRMPKAIPMNRYVKNIGIVFLTANRNSFTNSYPLFSKDGKKNSSYTVIQ